MRLTGQKYGFELEADLLHYTQMPAPGEFENRWLKIAKAMDGIWEITVRKGYQHDECTGVPNAKGTHKASPIHDAGYQFAEAIARAWKKTVAWVLRWFDRIFLERMVQDQASGFVVVLYYTGVSLLGYGFHQISRVYRAIVGRPLGIIKT